MRKYTSALIAAFCMTGASAQQSASGTLSGVPQFDFHYLHALSKPANALQQGQTIKLQARFVLNGNTGQTVYYPQHAVVAYTQRGATNSPQNTAGDLLWTHGVGAILGEKGLALELWLRSDTNGNGYDDDPANAIVWSQDRDRCAADVQGAIPPGVMCLAATPNPGGYLIPAPDFTLRTGVVYWLRVSITPAAQGWATLYADVIEEQSQAVMTQSASVAFQTATFFPVVGQQLAASVARTAVVSQQSDVQYIAFDYGF